MKRGVSGINCLLGLDKPQGISSHMLISRLRAALGEKRVGHAGTLDPLATGVMLVGVGQAARLLSLLTLDTKSYEARICFGASTTTDDAEGELLLKKPVPADVLSISFAEEKLCSLVGEHMQVPPRFSAISKDGKRAYARARAGEDFELAPRPISIYEAELLSVEATSDFVFWTVRLLVSKGCYIRSIARDLGDELGTGAHLSSLRRLSSGACTIDACMSAEELESLNPQNVAVHALNPLPLLGFVPYELNSDEEKSVLAGRSFPSRGALFSDGERLSLYKKDKLYGVWRAEGERLKAEVNVPAGVWGCSK